MKARIFEIHQGVLPEKDKKNLSGLIQAGALIVFPTDTVYGVGCAADSPGAAEKIFALKGREPFKPLPILVESLDEARRLSQGWNPLAEKLALRFWPGPLTLILTPSPSGKTLAHGFPTIGLRVPGHSLLRELLKESGKALASSSANASGFPSLKQGREVLQEFESKVDAILLEDSPLPGRESTVVDVSGAEARVLRQGAVDISI